MKEEHTSKWYKDIREFMESAGQTVNNEPTPLCEEDAILRARLIMEEALETCAALGVAIGVNIAESEEDASYEELSFDRLAFVKYDETDLLGVVDGCCDILVVTLGTMVSIGVPDHPFMKEVNQNNLSKVKPVAKIENGKIQKPPGYQPPNLANVMYQVFGEE